MPSYNKSSTDILAPERISVGWPWRLFLLSLVIAGLTVAIYLGLVFGYRPFLVSQIKNLDDQLAGLGQQISPKDRESFLNFYSQFVNIKNALNQHKKISQAFADLEKNTSQQISYSALFIDSSKNTLALEGAASSYDELAKQMSAYGKMADISEITLEDSQLTSRGVLFRARLSFKNSL